MEYLPAELKLKILKNFNFDELIKIKQINRHFYYFINKYKDELDHKRFERLVLTVTSRSEDEKITFLSNSLVEDMANDFYVINQKNWLFALDKQIPFFIVNTAIPGIRRPLFYFKQEGSQKNEFALKLPLFPQNIEELKIVCCWLLKIFNCVFNDIYFNDLLFNPEMFKLLFDNEEINKLKFNCQKVSTFSNQNIVAFKFTFDRLIISEELRIKFLYVGEQEPTDEENNFLLELLSNECYRIPLVFLDQFFNHVIKLYNLLVNHIETSTDLSKMVTKIKFYCMTQCMPRSKLIVRGVEMEESNDREKYYKITNIHDLKMMFKIEWIFEGENDVMRFIEIVKI